MVKKIRSNFNSLEEVLLFFRIFLLITILPVFIRLLSLPRLMRFLTPEDVKLNRAKLMQNQIERIERYTDYILCRNFWIYRNTCLKRALILYHFLRKAGMEVQICFGVKLTGAASNKKLDGHAWLLHQGEIFLEKDREHTKTFKTTYCYPEKREDSRQKEFKMDAEEFI